MRINLIMPNRSGLNVTKIFKTKNTNSSCNNSNNVKSVINNNFHYGSNMYYCPKISFGTKEATLNQNDIRKLNIPNLQFIDNNSIRGESLSHKRNIRFINDIEECGIKQVIDLKTADCSKNFQKIVESKNLSYMHFPIDSDKTPVRDIIDNLPEFFEKINEGNFYIACAQGLHRTDIALSINYLFNKKSSDIPPVLYGHIRKSGLRCDDIFKRCNNIFNNLTEQDRKALDLTDYTIEDYTNRKKALMNFNESIIESM